ncbi:MAG: hypothetical protein N4A50_07960 [Vallitalea sp.]|jgi:hypothetical protein|nr:hypothetical protein [Vallitalea sp.]
MNKLTKIIAIFLIITSVSIPISATENKINYISRSFSDIEIDSLQAYKELSSEPYIDEILTNEQIEKLSRIKSITTKMNSIGQRLINSDGKIAYNTSTNCISSVSKNDINYLANIIKEQEIKSKKSNLKYNDRQKLFMDKVKRSPSDNKIEITFDDGHTIGLISKTCKLNSNTGKWEEFDNPFKCNYNQVLLNKIIPMGNLNNNLNKKFAIKSGYSEKEVNTKDIYDDPAGKYTHEYIFYEFTGVSYASIRVKQYYTKSDSGEYGTLHIYKQQGGQSASGVIGVNNGSLSCNIDTTPYNGDYKIWTDVENEAIYNVTASIGGSFGLFSISLPDGVTWTRFAILRTSVIYIHEIAAIYL